MFKHPAGSLIVLGSLVVAVFSFAAAPAKPPPPAPFPADGVTLEECYRSALKVSETLAISEQEIKQLEAIYRQGVGNVLPNVSWNMHNLWQDTSNIGTSSGTVRAHQSQAFFQLQQPLFHGLRDFNAIRGYKSAKDAARFNRDQAALNLLADVADVFYVSLDLQNEIDVLQNQRVLTEDRLKELERRVRLGRSRDSEVLSAQVQMATINAQIEDTRQRWGIARQTLYYLTEVPMNVSLTEVRPVPPPPTLEQAHAKSGSRPDLQAAEKLQVQEQYRLRYAQGGYLPNLDFTGRYYTDRYLPRDESQWDALLNLNVPIFQGGITRAEVLEARALLNIADLETSRLRRQINREVETAHANLRYTVTQVSFYTKAVDLATRNYKLQEEEYRLGLINNLQVLDVLTDLQDLQIQKLRSEASMRVNDIRLRVAMGQGLQQQ